MNENLIDRYLLDQLSSEEKDSFEAQLKNDESLREKVELQKQLKETIEGFGRIEFKSKLQEIHNDVNTTKGGASNIRFLVYRLAIAAAFIGVISIGWLWMQQSPSTTTIYSQNFEPFELSLNERSETNETYTEIEKLYSKGDYENVIPLFQESLKNEDNSSQLLMGLGISFLQTNQTFKAIEQFEKILENKDFNFEDEVNWYLGLAYLKLEDKAKATTYLDQLANNSKSDHHKESKSIISQIKKHP